MAEALRAWLFSLKGLVQVHRTTSPFSINVPLPSHRYTALLIPAFFCAAALSNGPANPTIVTVTPAFASKLG